MFFGVLAFWVVGGIGVARVRDTYWKVRSWSDQTEGLLHGTHPRDAERRGYSSSAIFPTQATFSGPHVDATRRPGGRGRARFCRRCRFFLQVLFALCAALSPNGRPPVVVTVAWLYASLEKGFFVDSEAFRPGRWVDA